MLKAKLHGYDIGYDTSTGTGIHRFFKNICGPQWISDTKDNTDTSIGYDTGIDTWAKMEYPCNLG
jgi:hypothetical protein